MDLSNKDPATVSLDAVDLSQRGSRYHGSDRCGSRGYFDVNLAKGSLDTVNLSRRVTHNSSVRCGSRGSTRWEPRGSPDGICLDVDLVIANLPNVDLAMVSLNPVDLSRRGSHYSKSVQRKSGHS